MMVERLFLTVPRGCLQFVIVVFPDHTHLLFLTGHFCAVNALVRLCIIAGSSQPMLLSFLINSNISLYMYVH